MKQFTLFMTLLAFTFGFSQAQKTDTADFSEAFDGTVYTQSSEIFEHPTSAQSWAGFANMNTDMYPLTFENGGKITFDAPASSVGSTVRFRLEFNPYPDVNPAYDTADHVIVEGANEIVVPSQGANTFSSFILYIVDRDVAVTINSITITNFDVDGVTALTENSADFSEAFDGTIYTKTPETFEHPTSAQSWAGFANMNTDMYPLSFENAGTINFNAPASSVGSTVRFRLEFNPYPDVNPAYDTADHVIVEGANEIVVPSQGANTFSSFILYIVDRDVAVAMSDITITSDDNSAEPPAPEPAFSSYAYFNEAFDGTVYTPQTFEHPTSAQSWAGFANMNTDMYPLTFENGGKITFDAPASSVGSTVKFRLEFNPYPDVNPAYDTADHVIVEGANEIVIPSQGANTFSSFILYIVDRDVAVAMSNINVTSFDTDGVTELSTEYAYFKEAFDGTVYTPQTFEHPTSAQSWAGFANMNTTLYPLSFENGGTITFDAPATSVGSTVKFRLEFNPYPDVNPAYDTADYVIVAGANEIVIPSQGANTFSSFIMYVVDRDLPVALDLIKVTSNGASAGLEDNVLNSVKMFPNPAKDYVKFSTNSNEDLDIQIFDMLGKSVLRVDNVRNAVNVSGLNSGLYFVQMTLGTQKSTKKLVIN